MRKAVFLDRDGVLIRSDIVDGKPIAINNSAPSEILPGVEQACRQLKSAGFLLVMVTNQPDIGRGTQKWEVVEQMHSLLCEKLPIDRIEICAVPDDEAPGGERRKPRPGMLLDAALALNIDVPHSYLIGDRWRDIDCGHAAGCATVVIERGYNEALHQSPHHYASDVLEAARLILSLEQVRSATPESNRP